MDVLDKVAIESVAGGADDPPENGVRMTVDPAAMPVCPVAPQLATI